MKIFKNHITEAVLLIVVGAILLLMPGSTLDFFCRAAGILLIAMGVVKLLGYFLERDPDRRSMPELIAGIVVIVFGILMLAKPRFVVDFIPFAAGLIIAVGAVMSIVRSAKLLRAGDRSGLVPMALAVVTLIVAILVMAHPDALMKSIVKIIGVGLLIEGISVLAAVRRNDAQ